MLSKKNIHTYSLKNHNTKQKNHSPQVFPLHKNQDLPLRQRIGGSLFASSKVWTFLFCWISLLPKNWVPCSSPDYRPHIRKKLSLIAFRQIFPKILSVAYIFRDTIMTYLKSLLELNSLIQTSIQQGYLPELYPIIPINLCGKPWEYGRIPQ